MGDGMDTGLPDPDPVGDAPLWGAAAAATASAAAAVPATTTLPPSRSGRGVTWADGTGATTTVPPAGASVGPDVAAGAGAGAGAGWDVFSGVAPELAPFVPHAAPVAPAVPARPAWAVPVDYIGWEVDHHRFQFKKLLGKGE